MFSFQKILEKKGFPITEAQEHLKNIQNLSEESFFEDVEQRKWNIFKHHQEHNKLYAQFVNKKIIKWEDIPVLTKKDLQYPLEERLTKGYLKKDVYVNNTSGSSGHPFFFAKDKFCHALTWAVIFDRFGRHGLKFNTSKQARFYGIPLGFPKYHKEKLKDFFMNRVRFPVFDLSDESLEKYVNKISKQKFDYLNGYTSSIVLLAKYLINKKLVLKNLCPTLKVCVVTSEMCTDIDRKILEKGLGVPIINEYGASELDLIAFEDQDLDWILTNETLYIEIVDENNKVVPFGEEGRVLVTSLYNHAMPFIRYELGDIASLKEVKKGKNNILKSLIGRTNDVALLPSGKKVPGLTFYYISKAFLESSGSIKEFIIVQDKIDHFVFEYVANRELTSDEISEVKKMMNQYLEKGLSVSFDRKDVLKRTKAGKLKHFHTLLK